MRNIGFLLAPMVLAGFILPQRVLAKEVENQDKTQIYFEVDKNTTIYNGKLIATSLVRVPYNYPGYVPIEKKRNVAMSNSGVKAAAYALPQGKFTANVSAYTAAADECGKSDGITASGAKVKENRTMACPRQYPFGTKVKIEGYGTYVCEDRGGAIRGSKFDIYMETKKQAFAFGRRNLQAEVVK